MGFPSCAVVKNPPAKQETHVWSLSQEDPLEKEMASHSSILAWKIPWTEEPGRLQSMGLQRVRHDWVTHFHFLFSSLSLFNEYIFSWTYPPYLLTLVPLFLLSFCFTLPKKKTFFSKLLVWLSVMCFQLLSPPSHCFTFKIINLSCLEICSSSLNSALVLWI